MYDEIICFVNNGYILKKALSAVFVLIDLSAKDIDRNRSNSIIRVVINILK
jgi:hypothetical protein